MKATKSQQTLEQSRYICSFSVTFNLSVSGAPLACIHVVTIIYGKPKKKLLAESRTMSLSLRRFVALPKIVQADYQPRSPQDKTTQITV